MTSWIVSHTNRFKAAISERAVNNLVSMFGSSDVGWVFKGYHGDFVYEAVDKYLQISPWTYAKQIETPLLILHSENDLRCNIEQGEALFTTLRLLGKDVEMVRFPAESHELTRRGTPSTACSASSSCSSGSTASSNSRSAVNRTARHQRAESSRADRCAKVGPCSKATTEAPPTPPPAPLPSGPV